MDNGKNAISRWILNGQVHNAPKDWQTAECLATFDKENVQASLSIDKFTFVLDEATQLLNHISTGLTGGVGITEGVPLKLELHNNINQVNVFDGYIDLADGVEINEFKHEVKAKLRLRDELYTLEEKLTAISLGYLESAVIGLFSNSDYTTLDYVVEKKINLLETIVTNIAIFIMTKELIDTIVKMTTNSGHAVAHGTGGLPLPSAPLSAIIWGIVETTIEIVYAALLLVAILKLITTLFSQLIPVRRKAKVLNIKTALIKIAAHLGYGFNSNILDLDTTYFLPSNFNYDGVNSLGVISQWVGNKKGIPASSDYGYQCIEFFEIVKKLFNGKFAIYNNAICFYNVDDLFWVQQSTFQMPSIREKIKQYNTDELKANRYLTFDVDYSDTWTIDNYLGTSYEVITNSQIVNDIKLKAIRGLDEIRFGVCLASRKDAISGFESFLHSLASTADGIITTLGGQAIFAQQISSSIGLMKIGTNNWTKPKILKLDSNNRLVLRSLWGSKYIYDTYYKGKSFVSTVNGLSHYGQKEVYHNVKIPFGLNNFVELINNSYFHDIDGSVGKITKCVYRFYSDYATIDYFKRKSYTNNLIETFVEPTNQ
jgi:hypothetical protein